MKANEVLNFFSTDAEICGGTTENAGKFYWEISRDRNESIESRKGSKNDRFLLTLGRKLPGTKAHAKHWMDCGGLVEIISGHDIWQVLQYCEKIGFEPEFRPTKSGKFVRITDREGLAKAIKAYFA